MNRKISIIIFIGVVVLLVCVKIFFKSNSKETEFDFQTDNFSIKLNQDIENDIINAIEECKTMFKKYGSKNFDIYFGLNSINENLDNGEMYLIDKKVSFRDSFVKIYDIQGNEMENFPETLLDGQGIKYETDTYKIDSNKLYLIKVFSYQDSCNYYYLMSITSKGNPVLTPICYTIGETGENMYTEEKISE